MASFVLFGVAFSLKLLISASVTLKKRQVAISKKNSLGDYCVIITSRATNQSTEFSFFTYVIILTPLTTCNKMSHKFMVKLFDHQVDMVEIKEQYKQTYEKTLADDIKEHFKEEDIKNLLLALIKGKFVFLIQTSLN